MYVSFFRFCVFGQIPIVTPIFTSFLFADDIVEMLNIDIKIKTVKINFKAEDVHINFLLGLYLKDIIF